MIFSKDFLNDFLQSDFVKQNPKYKEFINNGDNKNTDNTESNGEISDSESKQEITEKSSKKLQDILDNPSMDVSTTDTDDDLIVLTDSDSEIDEEIQDDVGEDVLDDVVNIILKEKPEFNESQNDDVQSSDENPIDDIEDDRGNLNKENYDERFGSSPIEISDDENEKLYKKQGKVPNLKQGKTPNLKQGKVHKLRKRKSSIIELSDSDSSEEEGTQFKYSGVTITSIKDRKAENIEGSLKRKRDSTFEGKSVKEKLQKLNLIEDVSINFDDYQEYFEDEMAYYDEGFYEKYNCPVSECSLVFTDEDVEYGEAVNHIRFQHKQLSLDEIVEKLEHFEDIVSDNKYSLIQNMEVLPDWMPGTGGIEKEVILIKREEVKSESITEDIGIIEVLCKYECEVCHTDDMSSGAAYLHLTIHHDFTERQIQLNLK